MSQTTSLLHIIRDDDPLPPLPAEPAMPLKYEPDRFQRFAIEAIERGENVLITAKTGSGKTFVGEYQIARSLARGGRVFYTTPIKSLSNQKFHDLKALFPDASVGIMTGDIKFNPEAQILIMTTEILRNLLFKRGTSTESVGVTSVVSLKGLDAVVFDEVHYINDPSRGHVWEECLMLLPPEIHLVLLSATLAGTEPFARWIAESKGVALWLISTVWRAVPLYHNVWCGAGAAGDGTGAAAGGSGARKLIKDAKEVYYDDTYRSWLDERRGSYLAADVYKQKVKDARRAGVEGPIAGKKHVKSFEYELNSCVNQLHARGELPAICFVFSRIGCERAAAIIEADFLDSSDAAAVAHIWDFHLSRFSDSLQNMATAHTLRRLAQRGIAFHHSGLVPFLKEILEILFSKGLIKLLFATETFAVGINMPTKTVIFTGLEKYDGERGGFRVLRSDEYIQMAGRAGRRGKDDRGIVIYLPEREPIEGFEMRSMMTGGAARVTSRMTFDYDFILKTLQNPAMEWKALMEGSYWRRLFLSEMEALQREIVKKEGELSVIHLSEEQRSACSSFADIQARIAASGNSAKKKAQKELAAWEMEHSEKHWPATMERWRTWSGVAKEVDAMRNSAAAAEQEVGNDFRTRLQILQEFGYVEKDGEGWVITDRGRLASEINEGHPLLMTEMFMSGALKPLCLEDQLVVLGGFLGENTKDEAKQVRLEDTQLGKEQKEVLLQCEEKGRLFDKAEQRGGLADTYGYWQISYEWVDPVHDWLHGASLSEIAANYKLFEGNVQRMILKLAALAEEWIVLLTLQKDTEQLHVFERARELILRDIVIAESLYLRL